MYHESCTPLLPGKGEPKFSYWISTPFRSYSLSLWSCIIINRIKNSPPPLYPFRFSRENAPHAPHCLAVPAGIARAFCVLSCSPSGCFQRLLVKGLHIITCDRRTERILFSQLCAHKHNNIRSINLKFTNSSHGQHLTLHCSQCTALRKQKNKDLWVYLEPELFYFVLRELCEDSIVAAGRASPWIIRFIHSVRHIHKLRFPQLLPKMHIHPESSLQLKWLNKPYLLQFSPSVACCRDSSFSMSAMKTYVCQCV